MKTGTRVVAAIMIFFIFLSSARAGGFFSSFSKRIKRNIHRSVKRKAKRTEDRVKNRLTQGKENIIGSATSGTVGQAAAGGFSKKALQESLKQRLSDRVAASNPLAAAAADGRNPGEGLKSSIKDRIEAMRERLSADRLKDRLKSSLTGGTGIDTDDSSAAGERLADTLQQKIEALKARREAELMGKVDNATSVMDDVGATSAELDLNSSSFEEFAAVDGISEDDARKIIEWRGEHGQMEPEDLIKAVGFKKYLLLRTYLGSADDDDDNDDYEE